ncbi:MAG TPA: hypothetical protein VEB40_16045 [Flavipsychrobacter sp.]|nr:hypothetical protein [Flavipsychrobacter sp.]
MEKNSEILDELRQLQSPLAELPRHMPFEVPQNFFAELEGNILSALKVEELPLQWSDSMPHALPQNYFDTLPADILAKAKSTGKQNNRKTIALPFLVRAAAAVLILAVGLAGYKYFTDPPFNARQQLASVSDEAISSYLQQYTDEFDTEMIVNNLSASDLSELENIGNEEIIDYLNETGWDTNEKYN